MSGKTLIKLSSFPLSWLTTILLTIVTWWVPLVEHDQIVAEFIIVICLFFFFFFSFFCLLVCWVFLWFVCLFFCIVCVAKFLAFCEVICDSLFFLSFYLWPLYCLSFTADDYWWCILKLFLLWTDYISTNYKSTWNYFKSD